MIVRLRRVCRVLLSADSVDPIVDITADTFVSLATHPEIRIWWSWVDTAVAVASETPYQQRVLAAACTHGKCRRKLADGSDLCTRHLKQKRQRQAEWLQRKRDRRVAAGLCVWCPESGPPRASDGGHSCKPCRVRRNRVRDSEHGVDLDVDNRAERIAARTRTHADGRTRYHGQPRRGGLSKKDLNRQDLALAKECFETFVEGVAMIETDDVKKLPRIQRDGVISAVAHQGDRAQRHMDDILERLGHFKVKHGKRDGE